MKKKQPRTSGGARLRERGKIMIPVYVDAADVAAIDAAAIKENRSRSNFVHTYGIARAIEVAKQMAN